MPRTGKLGSTPKQKAYALRVWGGNGKNKTQMALDVGYSRHIAASPKSKIEDTRGFNNAIAKLATDSNNLALNVMATLKARGFEEFSNKDLVGALNAISGAWKNFTAPLLKSDDDSNKIGGGNKLRTVILQRIENQTVNTTKEEVKEVTELAPEDDF